MRAFDLVVARDCAHAVALLSRHGPAAKLLAGGTDLLADLKAAARGPAIIVDLTRIAELRRIAHDDDGVSIGALVTHTDLMRSPVIHELLPVLADAAHTVGAVQTRNLGTLGGNLVTCVPSMDSGPALLALEAQVGIAGPGGRRQLPLAEFFVGPRRTALAQDEMLIDIRIPRRNCGKPAAFHKFGLRKGQALALVNAAASLRVDNARRLFHEPRIALGAVAPTVMRAPLAEAFLEGRVVSEAAMIEAGRIAAGEAIPISDFRASAGYRCELIAVLVKRALQDALARAAAPHGAVAA